MPKAKTNDVVNKLRGRRKCKIIELCKSPEIDLTDDEIKAIVFRVHDNFFNPRMSEELHVCERKGTNIFMSAIRKLRSFFEENPNA